MCNLYSATTNVEAMRQLFDVDAADTHLGNAEPRTAVWPKYPAPVVRLNENGARELADMSWGFLTKNVSKKTGKELKPSAWNNARGDKVRTSGLWKGSFEERRCLVPATSFREAKGQRPAEDFWFALTGDEPRPAFAFAGLWRSTQAEFRDDKLLDMTHTILTTTANEIVRPVHPTRMPVILDASDYDTWLTGSPEEAFALVKPFPAERMRIVQQGVGVVSVRATPSCVFRMGPGDHNSNYVKRFQVFLKHGES